MEEKRTKKFVAKLRRVIDSERNRGIDYAAMIGCLEIIKCDLYNEMPDDEEETED